MVVRDESKEDVWCGLCKMAAARHLEVGKMRVLWIGFGQAGGKIVNSLMGMNRRLYSAIAVNTEEADLSGLRYIREKVLIGKYLSLIHI